MLSGHAVTSHGVLPLGKSVSRRAEVSSTGFPGEWCLPQLAQVALEPADVSIGNRVLDLVHCSALGTFQQ